MTTTSEFHDAATALAAGLAQTRSDLHSITLSHRGAVQGQWYASPRHGRTPHRMYSISKSITALAVGLLIDDGAFRLSSTMAQCFPDFAPMHEWVADATVADLLSMRSPHRETAYKRYSSDWPASTTWLEAFFRFPPSHAAGTVFRYDTGASYTLGALVERTAGVPLADYLGDRVLRHLGVGDVRYVRSPEGHSSGGSGLVAMPGDLATIAHWINNGGRHDGRQLLSADYLSAATTRQVATTLQEWGSPFQYGYGYQTWVPWPGAYLFFGMAGQYVLSIPEHDLVLVTTADTQRSPTGERDVFAGLVQILEHFYPGVAPRLPLERTGMHLVAEPPTLAGGFGTAADASIASGEPVAVADLNLDLGRDGGRLSWPGRGWDIPLTFGATTTAADLGGFGYTEIRSGWINPNLLTIAASIQAEEVSSVEIAVHLTGPDADRVTVQTRAFGELLPQDWTGVTTLARTNSPR